jgi:hypothetical protein
MSAADHAAFGKRREEHRINGCRENYVSSWDAVEQRLSEVHGLLSVMAVATAKGEFGMLNENIQRAAFDGLSHLIEDAHFHLEALDAS